MSCRFLSDETYVQEDALHRKLRVLEITFHNGVKAPIFVTDDPSGSFQTGTGRTMNVWHYQVSEDGKRITLTATPSSSVKILNADGSDQAHETITDWPLT